MSLQMKNSFNRKVVQTPAESITNEPDIHDPLLQLSKLSVPILNVGSVSLTGKLPIKFAAEKDIDETEQPFKGQVQIPLNVEVKKRSDRTKSNNKDPNSNTIGSKSRNQRHPHETMISPSTGSLLDNVTEISDPLSASATCQSMSNSDAYLEPVDLKSLHSSSVSSLSFQGKLLSKSSEDESTFSGPIRRKPVPNIKIPRGPTRRKDSDFTFVAEQLQETLPRDKKGTKPLGASEFEIKMINKFLAIAGPEFDGSHLSIEQREIIHNNALKAGLSETFINRMLDQSAGILSWEQTSTVSDQHSEKSKSRKAVLETPSGSTRTIRTKDTADDITKVTTGSSYSDDFTYDEDGFVRKSPKEDTFSCLKNIFWMESSNVVGDDMAENILAVMSADSESLYARKRQGKRR
ncbi:hypothetical protein IV203_034737 [Nitzschia inconspicua]|uniref:Uncharacterized protein n=1 Tax=Nitzschia inconspicua TaxID=303405 RepID=A0A9K3PWF7_9STRA|nr:hypothetical protein IV203_034737 [Nitzschia inconspicua]